MTSPPRATPRVHPRITRRAFGAASVGLASLAFDAGSADAHAPQTVQKNGASQASARADTAEGAPLSRGQRAALSREVAYWAGRRDETYDQLPEIERAIAAHFGAIALGGVPRADFDAAMTLARGPLIQPVQVLAPPPAELARLWKSATGGGHG